MWGFILPNQRQQTATRMHAFHIPHWRMNKRPCLFHLDQQLHVKKNLRLRRKSGNWAILKNPGGSIETGRTPAVLLELNPKIGKAVWSVSLRQTLVRQSRTLITSDEYMVCLDSSEQIFDLLVQPKTWGAVGIKKVTKWNLWKLIWNSVINGLCTLLFCNWTWSGVQRNGISINGPFSEGRVPFGVTLSSTHELEIFVDMQHACQMESICWNEDGCLLNAGKNLLWFHKLTSTNGN